MGGGCEDGKLLFRDIRMSLLEAFSQLLAALIKSTWATNQKPLSGSVTHKFWVWALRGGSRRFGTGRRPLAIHRERKWGEFEEEGELYSACGRE